MVEEPLFRLRKILAELEAIKGRHTELISVLIPSGGSVIDMMNQLRNEQGTADNIKSKGTRKNVVSALEKTMQHLKLYKKIPDNGVAIYCGNVSEHEGVDDIKLWAIEPPEKLGTKLYWCDQVFRLEPLQDMAAEKEIYGLVVMDNQEASIGMLKGKKIILIRKLESIVPSKTSKGGQCMGLDTLVFAADGNLVRMEDVRKGPNVKSVAFESHAVCDSPVLDAWRTEKEECYKIVTKCPRLEVESSKDHVFFVWEDGRIKEKAAEELKEGDTLLMPEKITVKGMRHKLKTDYFFSFTISMEGRQAIKDARTKRKMSQKQLAAEAGLTQTAESCVELGKRDFKVQNLKKICQVLELDFGKFFAEHVRPKGGVALPDTLNEDLAQLLGYFVGDGNYDKNRIAFSESDPQVARLYAGKIKGTFNAMALIKYRKNKHYHEIRVCSKAVESFMKGELLGSKDALHAGIPSKVLTSEDSVLAAFLKGLFDAEGYMSGGRFGFGVQSRTLATQVQMALLRFGIISSLLEYDCRKNPYSRNHRFTVEISEKESLELLRTNMGFSSRVKAKKLDSIIRNKTDKSEVRQVLASGKAVRALIEEHGMIKQDFPKVCDYFYDRKNIGKRTFANSILKPAEVNKKLHSNLESMLNCNTLPVKIRSITRRNGSIPMADISVSSRNFIANGLLVHNSAARFERVREGLINDFYKEIAENVRKALPKEVKAILFGGPGPAKETFLREEYLSSDLRKMILGPIGTGYSDEAGLEELVERGKEMIKEASIAKERDLVRKFLEYLQKGNGLAVYGIENVLEATRQGAVDIMLMSEGLNMVEVEVECPTGHIFKRFVKSEEAEKQVCQDHKHAAGLLGKMEAHEALEGVAEQFGTKLEVISKETREGEQLAALGGIAAILRYRIS
ncbi:MAG: LAGLIDADG family homing endonuclease [Candidatus Aenigmatarchaeota archaeon]